MTTPGRTTRAPTRSETAPPPAGRLRADPRLPGYLLAGFGALIAAITTGQPELAFLGAPFVALSALGLVDRRAADVTGELALNADRVIEGDVVDGVATIDWDGNAAVDVIVTDWRGVTPVGPSPQVSWSLNGRGPVRLPFQIRARSWGVHEVGTLWIRVRRPGGLLAWEQKVATAPRLRVLPTPLRLDRLLKPAEPRAVAGMHLSRSRGHGTDFAELRPYRPGDRLRDLSWATSARLGRPWVAVRHPERTGTVVLLLDAFATNEPTGAEALARAARAAWAVASLHLQAQDRVGLLAQGRAAAWIPPRGGRRARWLLLDELLAVGGAAEDVRQPWRRSRRAVVPTDALIVGVTGLGWQRFVRELLHYRRAGHTTVALVIDTSDLLPDPTSPLDSAARRIWIAQREVERTALDRAGVPTALVTATQGVGPAISSLRRRMAGLLRTGAGARTAQRARGRP